MATPTQPGHVDVFVHEILQKNQQIHLTQTQYLQLSQIYKDLLEKHETLQQSFNDTQQKLTAQTSTVTDLRKKLKKAKKEKEDSKKNITSVFAATNEEFESFVDQFEQGCSAMFDWMRECIQDILKSLDYNATQTHVLHDFLELCEYKKPSKEQRTKYAFDDRTRHRVASFRLHLKYLERTCRKLRDEASCSNTDIMSTLWNKMSFIPCFFQFMCKYYPRFRRGFRNVYQSNPQFVLSHTELKECLQWSDKYATSGKIIKLDDKSNEKIPNNNSVRKDNTDNDAAQTLLSLLQGGTSSCKNKCKGKKGTSTGTSLFGGSNTSRLLIFGGTSSSIPKFKPLSAIDETKSTDKQTTLNGPTTERMTVRTWLQTYTDFISKQTIRTRVDKHAQAVQDFHISKLKTHKEMYLRVYKLLTSSQTARNYADKLIGPAAKRFIDCIAHKFEKEIAYTALPKPIDSIADFRTLADDLSSKEGTYNFSADKLQLMLPHMTELEKMVGMKDIKTRITNLMKYTLLGLHTEDTMFHTVLTGPPGVGKSTVGEILGKIYHSLGLIKSDKPFVFKNVKRQDLVGEYLGQTAPKTQKAIDAALGGVLFIDEVYSLSNGSKRDSFAKECIDTINRNLTEHKGEFICIIAGYEREVMTDFLSMNPGLKRRFTQSFHIDKYNDRELRDIFEAKVNEAEWSLCDDDKKKLGEFFEEHKERFKYYGGDMEILFQEARTAYGNRIFGTNQAITKTISMKDIETAFKKKFDMSESEKAVKELLYSIYS